MNPVTERYRKTRTKEIGANLRVARMTAGWTQKQVAEYLLYSRAHVNRVEQGGTELYVADLELLAKAFGITLFNLID